MTFSGPWRPDQEYVSMLTHKVRGGQFINLSAIDGKRLTNYTVAGFA